MSFSNSNLWLFLFPSLFLSLSFASDSDHKENVDMTTICRLDLDDIKVKQFKDAIENSYWFEFFMDDLPLWGYVGELHSDKNSDNGKHFLYTHKKILQIIHVNLTQDNPKPLEAGRPLDMTYSVKWIPTNVTFERRFDVYLDYPFFEHQYLLAQLLEETGVVLQIIPVV